MNTEPKDTQHQSGQQEMHAGPGPAEDPQAVQVEKSGISAAESRRHRRWRNIALAAALGAFVVLIFVITLVKLGGNVMNRPL